MPQTPTPIVSEETPDIYDVLENVKTHLVTAKVRLKDLAKDFKSGEMKRDVQLSFSYGKDNWYNIVYSLKGDKLRDVAPLIEAYCHEKWCLCAVSGLRRSDWTTKQGEPRVTYYAQSLAFILDLHTMIVASEQLHEHNTATTTEEEESNSPF